MNHRTLRIFPAIVALIAGACSTDDAGHDTAPTGTEGSDTDGTTAATAGDDQNASTNGATDSSPVTGDESTGESAGGSTRGGDDTGATETGSTTTVSTDSTDSSASGSDTSDGGASEGSSSGSGGSTSGGMLEESTIYAIQDGTIAEDTQVLVQGVVVTAVAGNAIFVQEPAGGEYSGVYVYTMARPSVAVGDEVDVVGVTEEFGGLTEINATTGSVTATGNGGLELEPELVAAAELGEPWEGVLVRIEGAPLSVTALPVADEFEVDAGGAAVRIDDFLFSPLDDAKTFVDFGLGASFTAIQGPLNFFAGDFKIAPRGPTDLEGYVPSDMVGFAVDDLAEGELVVTEVMMNPLCPDDYCEWIEIYNNTDAPIDLQGLRIQDASGNEGLIGVSMVVPSFGYGVVAFRDMASWPYAFAPGAFYGTQPALGNSGDAVVLVNAGGLLDQTPTWSPDPPAGRSWRLDPTMLDAVANDVLANWCFSNTPLVDASVMNEFGTPGAVNGMECE